MDKEAWEERFLAQHGGDIKELSLLGYTCEKEEGSAWILGKVVGAMAENHQTGKEERPESLQHD